MQMFRGCRKLFFCEDAKKRRLTLSNTHRQEYHFVFVQDACPPKGPMVISSPKPDCRTFSDVSFANCVIITLAVMPSSRLPVFLLVSLLLLRPVQPACPLFSLSACSFLQLVIRKAKKNHWHHHFNGCISPAVCARESPFAAVAASGGKRSFFLFNDPTLDRLQIAFKSPPYDLYCRSLQI